MLIEDKTGVTNYHPNIQPNSSHVLVLMEETTYAQVYTWRHGSKTLLYVAHTGNGAVVRQWFLMW